MTKPQTVAVKDPTEHWSPPSADDGVPSDSQLLDMAIAAARTTPDEVNDALRALIGLVMSTAVREDCPAEIKTALLHSSQYLDARTVAIAYL